jgi:hypothetical protein
MNDFSATYIIKLSRSNPTKARAFLLDPATSFDIIELVQLRNAARALFEYKVADLLTEVINLKFLQHAN